MRMRVGVCVRRVYITIIWPSRKRVSVKQCVWRVCRVRVFNSITHIRCRQHMMSNDGDRDTAVTVTTWSRWRGKRVHFDFWSDRVVDVRVRGSRRYVNPVVRIVTALRVPLKACQTTCSASAVDLPAVLLQVSVNRVRGRLLPDTAELNAIEISPRVPRRCDRRANES